MPARQNKWPRSRRQQTLWLAARIDDWVAHAASLGIDPARASAFAAEVADVKMKMDQAAAARLVARGKTQTFYGAAAEMARTAGGLIKTIRGFAATTGAENIYELARLDPPAAPAPAPAPTMPTRITTDLENDGAITLRWTARNAAPSAGTAFIIYRKLAGESSYTPVGTTGVRHFTDQTVPAGSPSVTYMMRGLRGDKLGPFSEPVTVHLGKVDVAEGEQELSLAAA